MVFVLLFYGHYCKFLLCYIFVVLFGSFSLTPYAYQLYVCHIAIDIVMTIVTNIAEIFIFITKILAKYRYRDKNALSIFIVNTVKNGTLLVKTHF